MALADSVTGNPAADGWTFNGNSMANGVYVRGSANYSYDTYIAAMNVQAGSNLTIDDGDNSWLADDTVLGVGGHFVDTTAGEAGWPSFTGNAVNLYLGGTDFGADVKLQAKFGTRTAVDVASFAASTLAPDAGNGLGSFGTNGGTGAVQIRTSAYFAATDWSAGSGVLQLLKAANHIERNGTSTPDADVARLMWIWDPANQRVDTWEILLNTSLMDRLNPRFTGVTPAAEDLVLMTVQNRDGSYTDARVVGVPEPCTLVFLGTLAIGLLVHARRRR
jgi:hypothetical protein